MADFKLNYTGAQINTLLEKVNGISSFTGTQINTLLEKVNGISSFTGTQINNLLTKINSITHTATQINDAVSILNNITSATFNCTTSMTTTLCSCEYRHLGVCRSWVFSVRASSTLGRTRHTITLPSGYSFGTILMFHTYSNDNNVFTGYSKEFNCPLWVNSNTLYLDIHKGSGVASAYDPPCLQIWILTT